MLTVPPPAVCEPPPVPGPPVSVAGPVQAVTASTSARHRPSPNLVSRRIRPVGATPLANPASSTNGLDCLIQVLHFCEDPAFRTSWKSIPRPLGRSSTPTPQPPIERPWSTQL